MAMVEVVGRRRSNSGSYNPLAHNSVSEAPPDVWVCTAKHAVRLYLSDSLDSHPEKEVKIGAQLHASREGGWLRDKETGLYAPYLDKDGSKNFRNQRLMLMEKVCKDRDHADSGARMTRSVSDDSHNSTRSTQSAHSVGSGCRQNFRWVDAEGHTHEGSGEALKNHDAYPEIWVCVADHDVPYRSTTLLDAAVAGMECKVGGKVNAVREGDWLHVVAVSSHFDASASLGRRSLHVASHLAVEETGHCLPLVEKGERVFKNEKLLLFEEASQPQDAGGAGQEGGGCSVM